MTFKHKNNNQRSILDSITSFLGMNMDDINNINSTTSSSSSSIPLASLTSSSLLNYQDALYPGAMSEGSLYINPNENLMKLKENEEWIKRNNYYNYLRNPLSSSSSSSINGDNQGLNNFLNFPGREKDLLMGSQQQLQQQQQQQYQHHQQPLQQSYPQHEQQMFGLVNYPNFPSFPSFLNNSIPNENNSNFQASLVDNSNTNNNSYFENSSQLPVSALSSSSSTSSLLNNLDINSSSSTSSSTLATIDEPTSAPSSSITVTSGNEIFLRGKLDTQSWEYIGKWGVGEQAFGPGGILGEFHYKRDNKVIDSSEIPHEISMSGYFMIAQGKGLRIGYVFKKVLEKEISIIFKKDENDIYGNSYLVEGRGSNQFGKFSLDGTFNTATKDFNVQRKYISFTQTGTGDNNLTRPERSRRITTHHLTFEELQLALDVAKMYIPLIEKLMKADTKGFFHYPFDYKGLGLAEYRKVVKHPLDLGTIKKRLESKEYFNGDDVAKDIELVFNNASLFFSVDKKEHQAARQLLNMFNIEYNKLLLRTLPAKKRKEFVEMMNGNLTNNKDTNSNSNNDDDDESEEKIRDVNDSDTETDDENNINKDHHEQDKSNDKIEEVYEEEVEVEEEKEEIQESDEDRVDENANIDMNKKDESPEKEEEKIKEINMSEVMDIESNDNQLKTPYKIQKIEEKVEEEPTTTISTTTKNRKRINRDNDSILVKEELKYLREKVEIMSRQIEQLQKLFQTKSNQNNSNAFNESGSISNSNPKNETKSETKKRRPPSSTKKSSSEKKEKKPKDLSYQDKKQLSDDIRNLSPEHLIKVVEIIQESSGKLGGNDEELEIDIDLLDMPTLVSLQNYVKQVVS